MSGEERWAWLRALGIPLGEEPTILILPISTSGHRPPLDLPEDLLVVPVEVGREKASHGVQVDRPGAVIVAPPAVPARTGDVVFRTSEGTELQGEAAVLAKLLETADLRRRRFALFVTRALLVSPETRGFRRWLAAEREVEWILFPGTAGAAALGVPGLQMGVVVVGDQGTVGREDADVEASGGAGAQGDVSLTRWVDLDAKPDEWAEILSTAAKRLGGEVDTCIVLRDHQLGPEPWTYRRHSREYQQIRDDVARLGVGSRRLGTMAHVVEGLGPKDLTAYVRESRGGGLEPTLATFGRRSLAGSDLGRPTHMLAEVLVPQKHRLQTGDLLIAVPADAVTEAEKGSAPSGLTVVKVTEETLPAAVESDLVAVRFDAELPERQRELVEGYLASPHALAWLRAEGALPRVRAEHITRLPVPEPNTEVLEALEGLAEAENVYREWAREARQARSELFARSFFGDSVPSLLSRQRLERERVQAGRDSQTLDYRVRNDYPYPVAVRRENLLHRAGDEKLLSEVQECAEITVTLASLLALVQWRTLEGEGVATVPPYLAKYVNSDGFYFDWGKHRSFLDSVIAASRRVDNALALPIPELATLSPEDTWSRAEAKLRAARNRKAHLYRPAPGEMGDLAGGQTDALDELLRGFAFLSSVRVAVVVDYFRNPVSGERSVELEILRGASRAFPRLRIDVQEEVSRGSVGVLDSNQHFRLLTPWLVWEHCARCERPELFAFARFDGSSAEYLALATGHPWKSKLTNRHWKDLIEALQ